MKPPESADMNVKSIQESILLGHFSKSDTHYWQRAVFHQTYTHASKTLLTEDWAMRIAHKGGGKPFPSKLRTRRQPAARARNVNLLVANG